MTLPAVFIASLLGSTHCAAMCGGFSVYCSAQSPGSSRGGLAYHFGRLLAYLVLGSLAGGFGRLVDVSGSMVGFQHVTAIVTGALLLWWGLRLLVLPQAVLALSPDEGSLPSLAQTLFARAVRADASPLVRTFLIGFLTMLLPCGWLYMFVALAATAGGMVEGAITMIVFWLGTLPILVAVGSIGRVLMQKLGASVPIVTALLLIAAGLYSLELHFGFIGTSHHHHHHGMSHAPAAQ